MPCSAWKVPWAPVKPWVMTRVLASIRIAMAQAPFTAATTFCGRIGQVVGGDDGEAAIGQDLLAEVHIGALEPDDQRHVQVQGLGRGHDPFRDHVALGDAAEDVHQDRLDVGVRGDDPEGLGHPRRIRGAADIEEVGRATSRTA